MAVTESIFGWIYKRERSSFVVDGKRHLRGSRVTDDVKKRLWMSIWRNSTQLQWEGTRKFGCGGIFGLSYSPAGNILVAACENDCFIVTDPLTEKVVKLRENAHDDCCNNITFLDDRMFASCSDDCTVAVWDVRKLSDKVFSLHGHNSWVKNVELHRPTKRLVSAGFDNKVQQWDLNKTGDDGLVKADILLSVEGLLRMRLSPMGDSMYISSTAISEVISIHKLNLNLLRSDVGVLRKNSIYPGVRTLKKAIMPNATRDQIQIFENNHVDVFWKDCTLFSYSYGDDLPCHSIDVHPRNSAILLHHTSAQEKLTAVHSVGTQLSCGSIPANGTGAVLTQGLLTNTLLQEVSGSGEYIEEVSFSNCGKLIASPLGFGVTLATFDEEFNDYETHIASRMLKPKHASRDQMVSRKAAKRIKTGDHKTPTFKTPEHTGPSKLHVVEHCLGHRSQVLSTCFSPTHLQLASGSEQGLIVFHNPVL